MARSANEMALVEGGQSRYVIVVEDGATESEKTAARHLQATIEEITGVRLPVAGEAEGPKILVGAGKMARGLLPEVDWEALGSDGIVLRTVGEDLILAGGRTRGTLYAVFQFLEDAAGCRWWTPTERTIPKSANLVVGAQNVVYVPPFSYREHYTTPLQGDPAFATAMRENGHHQPQGSEWGGHHTMPGFVHTFSTLLPPEKYFPLHPEWYSDPDNGGLPCTADSRMPAPQSTQLNLSNPQVVEEMARQSLDFLRENPSADYLSISQNDNSNYCRDPASMKLAKAEGSQSGPLLKFVNQVAERIHREHPDIKIETLAYLHTEKPPKTIRPAKNVIVRLAPIASDYGHPLDSAWNQETRENLLAWAKVAPELFVWNYVTNFHHTMLPHPNWAGLGEDLRFFAAHNVSGIFEQGDIYTNGTSDFAPLRAWLLGHLMWNPQLDQKALTDEFLRGYYGAAAPFLKEYLETLQRAFLAKNVRLSTFNEDFSFFTLDVASEATRLFLEAARAVSDDPVLSERVRRESLSPWIVMLCRYHALKRQALREGRDFPGPEDPASALEEWISEASALGVRDWRENVSFASQIPMLREMFAPSAPLPDWADGEVIDIQESGFSLYHKGTLSDIVEDPAASNGKAAFVVGDTKEWEIQAKPGYALDAPAGRWRVRILARADLQKDQDRSGPGLSAGLYDATNRRDITSTSVPLKKIAGSRYHRIDLGSHPLHAGMFVWIAPTKNLSVKKIYVDRVLLVRESL